MSIKSFLLEQVWRLIKRNAAIAISEVDHNGFLIGPNPVQRVTYPESHYCVETMFEAFAKKTNHKKWYEGILTQASLSEPHLLPTWESVKSIEKLPVILDAPFTNVITPFSSQVSHTEWVLFYKDGRSELVTPSPTSGWSNIGNVTRFETSVPDEMPEGVEEAIQIVHGASSDSHGGYGIVWFLYRN